MRKIVNAGLLIGVLGIAVVAIVLPSPEREITIASDLVLAGAYVALVSKDNP